MSLQDCKAVYGLSGIGTNSRTNVSGSCTVGHSQTSMALPDSKEGFSIRMILSGAASEGVINPLTGSTSGSDSWTVGAAQVETNTIVAAGGCTSNGTMDLVVTAAGMTGSPITVGVALTTTTHTTANLIATAARTALAANSAIAAMFTVGGSAAAITLTRLPTSTLTVSTGTLNLYAANDATLNLSIPSGLGVTASTSSTNTTVGALSGGASIYDNALNFEGAAIDGMSITTGLFIKCTLGSCVITSTGFEKNMTAGGVLLDANNTSGIGVVGAMTITSDVATDLTITVIGERTVV